MKKKTLVPRIEAEKIIFDRSDTEKYQDYCMRWRNGKTIPELAEQEGTSNKQMVHRIALACGVRRISQEMKDWKRECSRNKHYTYQLQ